MSVLRKILGFVFFRLVGFRHSPVETAAWNREYESGRWQYLEEMKSLGGLVSILGYCQFLSPRTILDVGCGAGLLPQKLKVLPFASYHGIDISGIAVAQAGAAADPRMTFSTIDAHDFAAESDFDLIVFNQSIYYMPDPSAVIARYRAMLSPRGRIIVSMYNSGRTNAAWAGIEKMMAVEDAMSIRQGKGVVTTKVLMAAA